MSLTSKITVGYELINEIERVSTKRERVIRAITAADGAPVFGPSISLMDMAIYNAQWAIAHDDAVAAIAALQALRDFDEKD